MVHGVWCMVYGVWCMVYGAWCMVYGAWCVVSDKACVMGTMGYEARHMRCQVWGMCGIELWSEV